MHLEVSYTSRLIDTGFLFLQVVYEFIRWITYQQQHDPYQR